MKRILKIILGVLIIITAVIQVGCFKNDKLYTNEAGSKVAQIRFTDEFADNTLKPAFEKHLKEKYDEEFTVTYIEPNRTLSLCSYRGEVTAVEGQQRFEIFGSYYKDKTVTCEDTYFYYTIKDEYEKYISDIVAEIFPEHRIEKSYSFSRFLEIKKKISFEEFLESSVGNEKNSIYFRISMKESSLTNFEENVKNLISNLENSNYIGTITIFREPDYIYESEDEHFHENYFMIKFLKNETIIDKDDWEE